jgi:hypothetical protein
MRICRFCNRPEEQVRFYAPSTTAGRAAGRCCQPCWVAQSVEWRRRNRLKWNRTRHRSATKKRLSLTDAEYDALYSSQDPTCGGCGKAESSMAGKTRRLVVDHDHSTGRVRGLLCFDCNLAITQTNASPERLRALADYVERATDSCW